MSILVRCWIMLAVGFACPAYAELYRYQDAQGRWHFTDRVPASAQQKAQALHLDQSLEETEKQLQAQGQDLHAKLINVFTPDTPVEICLLYTSPSPRDQRGSRMPSSA